MSFVCRSCASTSRSRKIHGRRNLQGLPDPPRAGATDGPRGRRRPAVGTLIQVGSNDARGAIGGRGRALGGTSCEGETVNVVVVKTRSRHVSPPPAHGGIADLANTLPVQSSVLQQRLGHGFDLDPDRRARDHLASSGDHERDVLLQDLSRSGPANSCARGCRSRPLASRPVPPGVSRRRCRRTRSGVHARSIFRASDPGRGRPTTPGLGPSGCGPGRHRPGRS